MLSPLFGDIFSSRCICKVCNAAADVWYQIFFPFEISFKIFQLKCKIRIFLFLLESTLKFSRAGTSYVSLSCNAKKVKECKKMLIIFIDYVIFIRSV